MTRRAKRTRMLGCTAVVLALATSGFTPNGEHFFVPPPEGQPNLMYFGFVKDTNGKLITEPATFRIEVKSLEMDFHFQQDRPGHYRSPDVGAYHKEMGVPIDPTGISIVIDLPGWRQVRPANTTVPNKRTGAPNFSTKVPFKLMGTVNIDFVMERTSRAAR